MFVLVFCFANTLLTACFYFFLMNLCKPVSSLFLMTSSMAFGRIILVSMLSLPCEGVTACDLNYLGSTKTGASATTASYSDESDDSLFHLALSGGSQDESTGGDSVLWTTDSLVQRNDVACAGSLDGMACSMDASFYS